MTSCLTELTHSCGAELGVSQIDEICEEEIIEEILADNVVQVSRSLLLHPVPCIDPFMSQDPLYGQRHAYDILRVFCDMIADAPHDAKVLCATYSKTRCTALLCVYSLLEDLWLWRSLSAKSHRWGSFSSSLSSLER